MADAESSPLAFTYVAVKAKVQANAQAPLHAAKTSARPAPVARAAAPRGDPCAAGIIRTLPF